MESTRLMEGAAARGEGGREDGEWAEKKEQETASHSHKDPTG
jgi:hypothetical protein